jgi:hypothetical protein
MKLGNGLQTKNWPFIIGGPKFWSVGCIRPYLLNIKIFFQILAFIPCVKALRLISEFQPMRSMDFDNLKQQNGLDSSCKATLRIPLRLFKQASEGGIPTCPCCDTLPISLSWSPCALDICFSLEQIGEQLLGYHGRVNRSPCIVWIDY